MYRMDSNGEIKSTDKETLTNCCIFMTNFKDASSNDGDDEKSQRNATGNAVPRPGNEPN